jgi:hypothetical protein
MSPSAPFSTSSLKKKPPLYPYQIPFVKIDYTLSRSPIAMPKDACVAAGKEAMQARRAVH